MADGVQDGFAHHPIIEGWDVKDKKAFLIVLLVIPQVNKFPNSVIASKETDTKLLPLSGRT